MKHPMFVKATTVNLILALVLLNSCHSFKNVATARTPGKLIDDGFIQRIAYRQIRKLEPKVRTGNISVHAFNQTVLLTGQVDNSALVSMVESSVRRIRIVRHVHNEIVVSGPISLTVRASDAIVAGKVRSKMLATQNVNLNRFKVVTSNGVIFLMGLVTEDEANRAVEAIRTVFGVQKVVKVLEYVY
ncbi:MAG: BON domain-containing protein [Pseudomonadales bacterium]|nr:BON domain-containing protein [Pseudomonadales bacterium]